MGVVIINGQRYDSVSGLQIDEPAKTVQQIEVQKPQTIEVTSKPKRQSKQARLAEAIAREFEETIAEPVPAVTHEVPDWINEFKETVAQPVTHETPSWINDFAAEQQAKANAPQPDWITNYVTGGDPIEIQPIGLEAAAREAAKQHAKQQIHSVAAQNRRAPERSQTLNRHFVKKPTSASVATHPEVHRFAPAKEQIETITPSETKVEAETPFMPVMTHSMEEKLAQHEFAKITVTPAPVSSSSDLKKALISEQMDQPINHKAEKKAARTRRRFTAPTLITAALAILVLGGYFTYVSMPSISVRVAAARAGVDAHSPYMPNGYSIDGPVAYAPGRVTINYKSNGGGDGYSITQQNNTWGDNVVVDSLVEGSNYTTLEADGVTIYRFGDQTAWLQNGILFTLSGNNSFGDDQISRIVDSL